MMRTKTDFNKIVGAVDMSALETRTRKVIAAIKKYYVTYPKHGKIDFTIFIPFLQNVVLSGASKEDKLVYLNIAKNMTKNYPNESTRAGLMSSIQQVNLVQVVREVTESYIDGEEIDPALELTEALNTYNSAVGALDMPEVEENIDALLEDDASDHGVHWRLQAINDAMRPLRGGDFGILAARPDQGKTSLCCSELTFMAPQLPKDTPVLWLNNEGPGYRITPRLFQAALNCTNADLIKLKEDGELYSRYIDALGGQHRIRIMDIHGKNTGQVEAIIAAVKPGIILYDMIDNIKGFMTAARTDLQLELMYQWGRDMSVKYDAIGLATSQISVEGVDIQYPGMSCLKDSKTGKQGACDFQLMMGSMETKPEYANTRWLGLPKNKLRRLASKPLQCPVIFDKDKARFREMESK
jgi:replicative DNA helicase